MISILFSFAEGKKEVSIMFFVCRCAPPGAGSAAGLRRVGGGAQEPRRPRPHRPDGEAAQHPQHVLLGEPAAGRAAQGAAGGDDGAVVARHPRLVPEPPLQGQEEAHPQPVAGKSH